MSLTSSLLDKEWLDELDDEFKKPYWKKIESFVAAERKSRVVYPPVEDVFSAFNMTPFGATKVVILGQDPYIRPGQAHGFCFSVRPEIAIPPSLRNIYKELEADVPGFKAPPHGYLLEWAQQGILMLNATLTVQQGKSNSHAKCGWQEFTAAVIDRLNRRAQPTVFVLWGNFAKKKGAKIDRTKHRVVECAHPSPLSAKCWWGTRSFSKINAALAELGHSPIDWHISANVSQIDATKKAPHVEIDASTVAASSSSSSSSSKQRSIMQMFQRKRERSETPEETESLPKAKRVSATASSSSSSSSSSSYSSSPSTFSIVSWNVNGLNAVLKKGEFQKFIAAEQPDVLCIQETKMTEAKKPAAAVVEGYHHYWSCCKTKNGYSGTLTLTKERPEKVTYGLGPAASTQHADEGRCICMEFAGFFLLNCYVPNAGRNLERMAYKRQWNREMRAYLDELEKCKPIIYCGDLNVAHQELDLARPKTNHKTAGFTPEERQDFSELLDEGGYVDVWRQRNPSVQQFTYWGYRFNARARNVGWRLDYFVVADHFARYIDDCFIRDQVLGSDHCPLGITLPRSLLSCVPEEYKH